RVFARNPSIPEGRHLSLSGGPWMSHQGELLGAVEVFTDITHLKEIEEAERHAHASLDNIIEQVPAMIFVKEAKELRFERFNKAGEDLLGLKREQLLGKSDAHLFPEEQAKFFVQRDRETLARRVVVD